MRFRSAALEQSYGDTIRSLAAAVDARDSQTELHCERATNLSIQLGRYLGLDEESLHRLQIGAQLHDIGKIGIPTPYCSNQVRLQTKSGCSCGAILLSASR